MEKFKELTREGLRAYFEQGDVKDDRVNWSIDELVTLMINVEFEARRFPIIKDDALIAVSDSELVPFKKLVEAYHQKIQPNGGRDE